MVNILDANYCFFFFVSNIRKIGEFRLRQKQLISFKKKYMAGLFLCLFINQLGTSMVSQSLGEQYLPKNLVKLQSLTSFITAFFDHVIRSKSLHNQKSHTLILLKYALNSTKGALWHISKQLFVTTHKLSKKCLISKYLFHKTIGIMIIDQLLRH